MPMDVIWFMSCLAVQGLLSRLTKFRIDFGRDTNTAINNQHSWLLECIAMCMDCVKHSNPQARCWLLQFCTRIWHLHGEVPQSPGWILRSLWLNFYVCCLNFEMSPASWSLYSFLLYGTCEMLNNTFYLLPFKDNPLVLLDFMVTSSDGVRTLSLGGGNFTPI